MAYTGRNISYWIANPLNQREIALLSRIGTGVQSYYADRYTGGERFAIAYLIARGCLQADTSTEEPLLTLTPKGRDALDFYRTSKGR